MRNINNLPEYANQYDHIVYRMVDGEAWFYGAYSTEKRALQVADMVEGESAFNEGR